MISILHPSRQRYEKSLSTCYKWLEMAGTDQVELIISIDNDDPDKNRYHENFVRLHASGFNVTAIQSANRSAVDAINNAAQKAKGDIFIVVSDDTDCPNDWDVQILKATEGKKDWIAKCPDGIQDWIITMPLMDRAYYERFGYIYYPEFRHMFADTELSCVADLIGRKIDLPTLFPHQHYSVGGIPKDAVSEKADATWSHGEALFIKRYKENFGLVDPTGKITNQTYLNWIAGKL